MQRLRGEITVFLSLILVCVFSLMMGLLESARTAGARLYLQMAADSALFSVMSQYNRNLWGRYRLLFLESSSSPSAPSKNLPCSRAENALLEASSASEAAQDSAASHVRRGLLLKPLPSPRQTALCLLRFLRSLQTDRRFLKRRFVRAPPAILCRSCDRRSSAQPASRF